MRDRLCPYLCPIQLAIFAIVEKNQVLIKLETEWDPVFRVKIMVYVDPVCVS